MTYPLNLVRGGFYGQWRSQRKGMGAATQPTGPSLTTPLANCKRVCAGVAVALSGQDIVMYLLPDDNGVSGISKGGGGGKFFELQK